MLYIRGEEINKATLAKKIDGSLLNPFTTKEEIENLIMRVECVQEVVVFGVKNEKGDEHSLGAEVYLNTPTPEKEVKDLIAKELQDQPTYKKITRVVVRDEPFEKTTSNKIIRPKRD